MKRTVAGNINMLAGTWVFVSALLWLHSSLEFANTLVIGLVVIGASAGGQRIPKLRYLNTVAGTWLFVSALYLHAFSPATRWNNLAVGLVISLLSLVGEPPRSPRVQSPT